MSFSKKIYQLSFAPAMILLVCAPTLAEEASPLTDIYACAEISDGTARLICYDNAVASARSAEDAGEFTTITRSEAEAVQRDAFGFQMPSLPKLAIPKLGGSSRDDGLKTDSDGQITEVELTISSISQDAFGKVILTFENGQVWIQTDSERIRISKKRPPVSAVIKRASLGSFLIRLSTGERFRGQRVE